MECPIGSDAECDLVRCDVVIYGGKTVSLLEDYIDRCLHRDALVGYACRGLLNAQEYTANLLGVSHVVDHVYVASSPNVFEPLFMRYFNQIVDRIRPEIVILDVISDQLDKLNSTQEIVEFAKFLRAFSTILICMGGAKHVVLAGPLYRRHNLACSVQEYVEKSQ